jgi:hypothetical protein
LLLPASNFMSAPQLGVSLALATERALRKARSVCRGGLAR